MAKLRDDALAIWNAGVAAVRSDFLVEQAVHVAGDRLVVCGQALPLSEIQRIVVVGAGKAGAGMAAGLLRALGKEVVEAKRVTGWINVPDDCVRSSGPITLHGARPAGVNEPTPAGIEGTSRILELVESASAADLVLCLISGGGSALMPAPIDGISLADKQAVTKHLSGAGANIQELNTVRKQLSRIKGGGLARHCRAGRLITLVISDVLGDPLEIIASGPTVWDTSTPQDAMAVLNRFRARDAGIPRRVFEALRNAKPQEKSQASPRCSIENYVIGNNETAVRAAGREAEKRGYETTLAPGQKLEGDAEEIGRQHTDQAIQWQRQGGVKCRVSGGEPVVKLVPPSQRGKGGRNQQVVLAALDHVMNRAATAPANPLEGIAILSGGTDGEDGPTDAAGAFADAPLFRRLQQTNLLPNDFLRRNDAYTFFEALDGLLKTGPTHTNVCDVRVVLVDSTGGIV